MSFLYCIIFVGGSEKKYEHFIEYLCEEGVYCTKVFQDISSQFFWLFQEAIKVNKTLKIRLIWLKMDEYHAWYSTNPILRKVKVNVQTLCTYGYFHSIFSSKWLFF